MLGKPNGEAIYPLIQTPGQTGMVYSYSHLKGSVFNMKFYNKALVISLDASDIVADVEFVSKDEK